MLRDYLPKFSNMDYGFLYEFSTKNANRTLFFSDIFLPIQKSKENVLFFQSYFGYNSFSSSSSYENNTASYRMDVSAGGGYRFFLPGPLIQGFGLNLFFDTSKIYGQWYNSWGAGLEVVWQGPGNSLFDLSINNYGNQFADLEDAVNLWRKGDVNFDLEAGYSSGFYDGTVDLRVKANAYQFSLGDEKYISGYKVGADLKTGNGLLKVGYDLGHDKDKGTYNSISAVINVGFSPEDIFYGKNPFSMPQPIFMSPQRNPERILSQKVHRNTNLPDKVVTANKKSQPYFQVTINGPYSYGSGTYTQSSNIAGTWNITPATDGIDFHTAAASYTITLSGDVTELTFPVTATITPNVIISTGQLTVAQSGVAGIAETVTFNSPTDLIKIIPPNGNSVGTSAVPDITRERNSGSSGTQGTITVTATGVQTLTIDVVSGSEPSPGVVYFTVAMNGPYSYGSGTYTQSSNTSGTWNITPSIDGANYHTKASSYTVTLSGDTGSLTYPITATITPNVTVATGVFTVAQSGATGVAETVTFNNSSDLIKTIPPSGNSVGTSAVPNITRQRTSGSSGTQGTIAVTATGVQSLTIDVVSGNEPTCDNMCRTTPAGTVGGATSYVKDFNEGNVPIACVTNDGCINITFNWTGYAFDNGVIIYLVFSNGSGVNIGTTSYLNSATGGTVSFTTSQSILGPYLSIGDLRGLHMDLGHWQISIDSPAICFNEACP